MDTTVQVDRPEALPRRESDIGRRDEQRNLLLLDRPAEQLAGKRSDQQQIFVDASHREGARRIPKAEIEHHAALQFDFVQGHLKVRAKGQPEAILRKTNDAIEPIRFPLLVVVAIVELLPSRLIGQDLSPIILLDRQIASTTERFQIFESDVEELIDVQTMFGRFFHRANHRDGVVAQENVLAVENQNGRGEAKENLRSFEEKTVPNAQKTLERHVVDENGQEPVQRDRGEIDFARLQMFGQVQRFFPQNFFQNVLIDLRADQILMVIIRQVTLADQNQQPERLFAIDEEQREGNEKVHSLAVADRRIVQTEGAKNLLQLTNLDGFGLSSRKFSLLSTYAVRVFRSETKMIRHRSIQIQGDLFLEFAVQLKLDEAFDEEFSPVVSLRFSPRDRRDSDNSSGLSPDEDQPRSSRSPDARIPLGGDSASRVEGEFSEFSTRSFGRN